MTLSVHQAFRVFRFLAAGLPGFAVALLANRLFVETLHWPKPVSYIAVLAIQVTINFFVCRFFVFTANTGHSVFRTYFTFLGGSAGTRVLEWLFYTTLVEFFRFHYLAVQLGSIVIFSLFKFKFAESIFEARNRKAISESDLRLDESSPSVLVPESADLIRPDTEPTGLR